MDRRQAAPTAGGRPPHPAQDAGVGTEGRGRCRSTLRALKRRRGPGGPGQGVKQQMLTGRQILTENWKRGGLRCLGQRERRGSCQVRGCWERSVYSEEGEGTLRGWWRREAQHSHKPHPDPLPPAPSGLGTSSWKPTVLRRTGEESLWPCSFQRERPRGGDLGPTEVGHEGGGRGPSGRNRGGPTVVMATQADPAAPSPRRLHLRVSSETRSPEALPGQRGVRTAEPGVCDPPFPEGPAPGRAGHSPGTG